MTANDDTTAHWGLPAFTGALLATFVAYMVAWYLGIVAGNFALVLFVLTVVTGLYWVAEKLWFKPQRLRAADTLAKNLTARRTALAGQGINQLDPLFPTAIP